MRFGTALLLALVLAVPAAADTFAIRNVTVVDGTGAPARGGVTVVVRDGRIEKIGPKVRAPRGARVVDGTGKFLIPGLWDMHVHLAKAGEHTLPMFIANGVTSVRDMGGEWEKSLRWRHDVLAGTRVGPRIKTAGPILESATNYARQIRDGGVEQYDKTRIGVGTVAEAETAVEKVASLGGDFVKIRTVASSEVYRAIAAAAKKRGLAVVGHAAASPAEMLAAGQASIEHPLYATMNMPDAGRAELFKKIATAGMVSVPTLSTGEFSMFIANDRAHAITEDIEGKIDARRKYLGGFLIDDWREQVAERKDDKTDWRKFSEPILRDLREMRAAGVTMMPGTDVAVVLIFPGFALHDELVLMHRNIGMTAMEVLVSATRKPAEFFGIDKALGTIEEGKLADLVLLAANPLADIANTRKIEAVVAQGRLYDRKALDALLAGVESAAKALRSAK